MKVLLHVNYYEGAGKFETLFKIIKAVGADGVELRAKNYYNMGKENYFAMVEDLKQRYPELELAFGYQLPFNTDADTQKQDFEDFVNFLDWAKEKCGTKLLNMFTDNLIAEGVDYYDFSLNGSALATEEMYARHGEGLTRAGNELEKRGMIAGLETHNCYIHDIAKSCAKLAEYIKSPAVGFNYDHGNIFLNKNGETIDEVFELLKGKIHYAHLKNLMRSRDLKYYYATHLEAGHIDTGKVLGKLKDEVKSGIIAVEYACPGDGFIAAKRDIEYVNFLRGWLNF
ncbi:MAG: TIM barrel protein [Lentisphaeria bacterium]|nr:TIM barrel protein [Lentisphaeria bacterium]